MRPALDVLSDREAHSLRDIRERLAEMLSVGEDDQQEMLASGRQSKYANRVGWALVHMSKAGVVTRPSRGRYVITERGVRVLHDNPRRVDMNVLHAFPEYVTFRTSVPSVSGTVRESPELAGTTGELSPSEALDQLVRKSDAAVAVDLLDRVIAQPPVFLERLAIHLLGAMGYGGREALIEHTGGSGDSGLDGIVRQDALGIDLVGVQAKRFDKEASVGRPIIQGFVGALQGAQTNRGVFVTTGRFSAAARQFAENVAMRLVLIDGPELAQLMMRYGVGISVSETFELRQIDDDFFDG